MNAQEIEDQKSIARDMFVRHTVHSNAEALAQGNTITAKAKQNGVLEPAPGNEFPDPADKSFLSANRAVITKLIGVLRQLEDFARRQSPRIAIKSNGRILFLDLAEVMAVQAEGNYISLRHQPNTYLLRESLSSIAEKLRPYGFIRIHRSVVVNISSVERIQPLPTGEYSLHVKMAGNSW